MPNKLYKISLFLGVFLILLFVIAFLFLQNKKEKFEISFLDVGQGDSVLIKTEEGQNILIDGGPDKTVVKRLSENLAWWDRTIDLMILTHPHADHVSGLVHVLNRYKVKMILYTGVIHTAPEYLEWLQIIKDKNITLKIIDHPQRVNLDEKTNFEILYPDENFVGAQVDNLNNSSIVLKLNHGENSFFFAGDIEEKLEKELIDKKIDLSAKVFKANHHGSDKSNIDDFIRAVNPEIIVITVGDNNQFNHPNPKTLKRFERIKAKIYRTDQGGTIKVKSDGKNISIIK